MTHGQLVAQSKQWSSASLPRTWADSIELYTPRGLYELVSGALRSFLRRSRPLELPEGLPGREGLPAYLLQEFHGMPNGYYSQTLAENYAKGFNLVMLGLMRGASARIAGHLAGGHRVLDLGCGAGRVAQALVDAGGHEVWGLDPCPYALRVASRDLPEVTFVQGLAEDTRFDDGFFDGVGASFLFHELPGATADRTLRELHRVIKPGGMLAITEPSPLHIGSSVWKLVSTGYWLGPWFRLLARMVYEPFLQDWVSKEPRAWLEANGFELVQDAVGVPFREIVARRV